MLTEGQRKYMKERRRKLRMEGTCVDCQKRPAKLNPKFQRGRHTCCEWCLAQRRARTNASTRQYSLALNASTEFTL
jgi:hypothetical protein